jgi:hypothetical protein
MGIDSKGLKAAACCAMMEANRWKAVAKKIEDEKGLFREKIVILSYVAELYLKSILMYNDINIMENNKKNKGPGHKLFDLYKLLPENIKNIFLHELKLEPITVKDFYTGQVKRIYNSLDEILELISNNFIDLRYNYEQYAKRKTYFSN